MKAFLQSVVAVFVCELGGVGPDEKDPREVLIPQPTYPNNSPVDRHHVP